MRKADKEKFSNIIKDKFNEIDNIQKDKTQVQLIPIKVYNEYYNLKVTVNYTHIKTTERTFYFKAFDDTVKVMGFREIIKRKELDAVSFVFDELHEFNNSFQK